MSYLTILPTTSKPQCGGSSKGNLKTSGRREIDEDDGAVEPPILQGALRSVEPYNPEKEARYSRWKKARQKDLVEGREKGRDVTATVC